MGAGSVRIVNGNLPRSTCQKANSPFDGAILPDDWNN